MPTAQYCKKNWSTWSCWIAGIRRNSFFSHPPPPLLFKTNRKIQHRAFYNLSTDRPDTYQSCQLSLHMSFYIYIYCTSCKMNVPRIKLLTCPHTYMHSRSIRWNTDDKYVLILTFVTTVSNMNSVIIGMRTTEQTAPTSPTAMRTTKMIHLHFFTWTDLLAIWWQPLNLKWDLRL